MMLTSASSSVLKCSRSSNSSSYCSSASSCWLTVTFCPASFSTSAIYSMPVLPASPCSATSRRRNWPISAGVHCSTLISRAVSRISAFFVFKSSVIGLCLDDRRLENEKGARSEEHSPELQSPHHLVCRLLLQKKKHQPA